jgi:hypothetical protein
MLRSTRGKAVPEIVKGIRKNGKAVGKNTPGDLDNGKKEVQEKCSTYTFYIFICMLMSMTVFMVLIHRFLPFLD